MKILFVTARFPYPPIKGDKIISYQRLKYFSRKHEITLLSLADTNVLPKHLAAVKRYCKQIHIIPLCRAESIAHILLGCLSDTPLQVLFYKSQRFKLKLENLLKENKYDLVHTFMLRMAPYIASHKEFPKIIELIDSMELNMRKRVSLEKNFKRWLFGEEARRLSFYEKSTVEKFDYAIVVSEIDKKVIKADNIVVSPNGVDSETFYPMTSSKKEEHLIIFTGNMGYFPNEQAVLYFVNYIFPLIQNKHPNAKFWVVGCNPPRRIKKLEKVSNAIRVLGYVDSVADYINKATVSVCPMNSGSGMQNKILEALACGVPVVATSLAKGDIKLNENDGIFVSDTATSFADTVIDIMANTNLQNTIEKKAPQIIQKRYSWERSNFIVENIYSKLANVKE